MRKLSLGISLVILAGMVVGTSIVFGGTEDEGSLATVEKETNIEKSENEELRTIAEIILEELQDYDQIEHVTVSQHESITIKTSFDESELETEGIAREIKQIVEEALINKESLHSISNIDSYKINVRAKKEERNDGDQEKFKENEEAALKREEREKLSLLILEKIEVKEAQSAKVLRNPEMIQIGTSLDKTNPHVQVDDIVKELQNNIESVVKSVELEHLSNIDSFEIEILDMEGRALN